MILTTFLIATDFVTIQVYAETMEVFSSSF